MKSSKPLAGSKLVICLGGSATIVGVLSSSSTLRAARSAAVARSGLSPASKTMARTPPPARERSTTDPKSSQRSRVCTSAPSCRSIAATPSGASSRGRWPTTSTRRPVFAGASATGSAEVRAAHGDGRDLDRGAAHAHRHALPVLAARPDAVAHLDVVAEHRDLAQDLGAVADEVHALQGRGDLAVLDEVALGQREDEVAVGDVDLTPAELLRIHPAFHAPEDLLGITLTGEQDGVGHARHGRAREALAPAVAAGLQTVVSRAQPVVHVA